MLQSLATTPKEQAKASRTAVKLEPHRFLHPPFSGIASLRHDTGHGLRSALARNAFAEHFLTQTLYPRLLSSSRLVIAVRF
jgi:hypothetical protein